jgi:hypothetical protein
MQPRLGFLLLVLVFDIVDRQVQIRPELLNTVVDFVDVGAEANHYPY